MKITFVMAGGFNLTGGERVIATYAKALQQRGHEVLAVSRPPVRPGLRDQLRSLRQGKGWITPAPQGASHIRQANIPHRLLESFRPVTDTDVPDADIVIATWWETAEWVANLSPSKGAKVYFIQHHEVFDYLPQAQAAASYKLPLHKIVVAQWLLDIMREEYGDESASLVLNSVDTNQFYAPPRQKQPQPTVGLIYSAQDWKGCDISLKAFSIAAQQVPNLKLVAFGHALPSIELPLPPEAEFVCTPSQAELKHLYAACDVWLFGSRTEGFGLPILEAMACRTPVIGTPAGAAPDLLPQGGGILVNPNDPEDMARAIEKFCALSEEEWQERSQQAYTTATAYTWEDATDRFEASLQVAIDRSRVQLVCSL